MSTWPHSHTVSITILKDAFKYSNELLGRLLFIFKCFTNLKDLFINLKYKYLYLYNVRVYLD